MIVIDTHAMVWWTSGIPSQLSMAARRSIVDSDVVAFSAVSVWEVGILAHRGRIDLHLDVADWLREVTEVHSLEVLPVTLDIAVRASELHDILRDPIDCLITATALINKRAARHKRRPHPQERCRRHDLVAKRPPSLSGSLDVGDAASFADDLSEALRPAKRRAAGA